MTQPQIKWFEGTNTTNTEVTSIINFGVVDADTSSQVKEFYIFNNRAGTEDVSNAEDITFTVRDLLGGLGDTPGNIVEPVRDNWFQVQCDSLNESTFTPVGKGGTGTVNPSGLHPIGTSGSSANINESSAVTWSANAPLSLNSYVKPTVSNGYIYKVVTAGVTGSSEPTWLTTEGLINADGSVQLQAYQIVKIAPNNTLLGRANNTLADGSNADLAGGNWTKISTKAVVPITASSGKSSANFRVK